MKSKFIFISLVVSICALVSVCCTKAGAVISSVRTYSEYNSLSKEEQKKVISSFDKMSEDALEEEIFELTEVYWAKSSLKDFELKSIKVTKNNLLLSSAENRKVRCNGSLYIDFFVDNSDCIWDEDSAKQSMEEFFEFLYEDLLVSSQIMSIELLVWSDEDNVLSSYGGGYIDIAFDPYLEQDENEYKVQTLVYDYGKDLKYLALQKFGYINDSELYVEYLVDNEYLTSSEEVDWKRNFTDIAMLLLSNEFSVNYIERAKISQITVAFLTNTLGENIAKYSLEI